VRYHLHQILSIFEAVNQVLYTCIIQLQKFEWVTMILIILAQKHLKIERLYYLLDNQRIEYSCLNFQCVELCFKYIFILLFVHVQLVIFVTDEFYCPERILKLLNL
jgi:hypothetical protein